MAKQAGPFFFIGKIDGLIFYKQGDQYYVRRESEPTAGVKKHLKDKAVYPLMHRARMSLDRPPSWPVRCTGHYPRLSVYTSCMGN